MGVLPLYEGAKQARKQPDSHAGLWYDRFFNQYDKDWSVGDSGKINWIKTVTSSPVGQETQLEEGCLRQRLVCESQGGTSMVMSSQWHFVAGMGNNHPVENGFAWHHTLGVPYLTSAAVKGMLRAWCEVWQGFDAEKIKQWFGDTEQSGEVLFFDALPTKPVQLKADIMTPHYGDWYAKGDEAPKRDGSNVPADWHDPVPIPFLVVDKGQSFQFCLAKRAGSKVNLADVSQALTDALQWLGAGAKTAVGYGRFEEDAQEKMRREKQMKEQAQAAEAAKQLAEQEVRRASMSPLEAELDRWLSSNPEPNTVTTWLQDIDTRAAIEQQQIAMVLKQYYEDRGTWKKPSKKQKPNVQKIKQVLNKVVS